MSLSDKLTGKEPVAKLVSGRPPLGRCLVARIMRDPRLSAEDAAKLEEVIEAPPGTPNRLTNVALVKVLRSEGFELSAGAMDRHRNQSCGCYYYAASNNEQE